MEKVSDFVELCKKIIEDEPPNGNEHMQRSYTVLKNSIMYLTSERKLKLTDPIEEWKHYWGAFSLSDHYKVAEEYLRRTGQPPLNYTDDKFRS